MNGNIWTIAQDEDIFNEVFSKAEKKKHIDLDNMDEVEIYGSIISSLYFNSSRDDPKKIIEIEEYPIEVFVPEFIELLNTHDIEKPKIIFYETITRTRKIANSSFNVMYLVVGLEFNNIDDKIKILRNMI